MLLQGNLWELYLLVPCIDQGAGNCVYVCVCLCSVTKLCPTLFDPMGYSLPGSSVCGIFQERILEWVAISSSGHLLHPDTEPVSPVSPALADGFFNTEPPGKLTLWLGLGQKLLDFYENHLRSFVKLDSQIEGDLKVLWLSHSTLSPTSFDSWLLLCNILARWLAWLCYIHWRALSLDQLYSL